MKLKNFKGVKGFIIIIVLVLLIVGYFYYLSNRKYEESHEEDIKISAAKELLLLDFENAYPPTPKEVVKCYEQFTKVLHNEDLSDEEVKEVGIKLQGLFDEELVNSKDEDEYIRDLKSEIITFKDNKYSIVNMYTSASTDVYEFEMDGYKCARLYGTFNIRTSQGTKILKDVFILRKDSKGHWKIYGFEPVSNEEDE